jgi:hypothetical protein
MSDQEAADDLNTVYRSVDVTSVKASVVLEATVVTEYNALAAAKQELYRSMLAMGELNPNGTNTKAIFADLFGGGTTTRSNLLALSTKNVSRAVELLGEGSAVTAELVAAARSYTP